MSSKKPPYLTHLSALTGTEVFHLVAGALFDGSGNVTHEGDSRYSLLTDIKTFVLAGFSGGISQATADGRYLQKANNLSELASAATARTNLGLGSAATFASGGFLQPGNNLSDVGSAATARTNLGLGSAATFASGGFLQPGNNLSDVTNAATARANLGITAGGNWWAGHMPTTAILPTVITIGAAIDATVTDDANVGMTFDSGNASAAENFRGRCQVAPSNAASWTATCRITPNLPNVATTGFGMFLGTTDSNKWASLWLASYGGGIWIGERRIYSGGALAGDFNYAVEACNLPVWLRIRWDQPTATYYYDMSRDGVKWRNCGTRTIANLGFTPTYIGVGCYVNNGTASNNILGSCDYWVVG